MSWTALRTYVAGEILTAAILNTDHRDNVGIVKTNLDDAGAFAPGISTLTIASGACSPSQNRHAIDGAATDTLTTLNIGGAVRDGHVLILSAANLAHVVTVKDGVGNLQLASGDFVLDSTAKLLVLQLTGTTWIELSRAGDRAVVQTTTLTGTQNDFALLPGCALLRCNNATLLTLTGFSAGYNGQRLTVTSVGAGQVDLAHQNTGSVAANRAINFATSAACVTSAAAGVGSFLYEYDAVALRWRLKAHEQGAWITPAFNAANYTNNNLTAWTVSAGDVAFFAYRLSGRTLSVLFDIGSTTVGTGATALRVVLPGGFSIAKSAFIPCWISDNGSPSIGIVSVGVSFPNTLEIFHASTAQAWSVATDATAVTGSLTFEVT